MYHASWALTIGKCTCIFRKELFHFLHICCEIINCLLDYNSNLFYIFCATTFHRSRNPYLPDIASHRNSQSLPIIKPYTGPKLPPDRYCLSAMNYQLKARPKPQLSYTMPGTLYPTHVVSVETLRNHILCDMGVFQKFKFYSNYIFEIGKLLGRRESVYGII